MLFSQNDVCSPERRGRRRRGSEAARRDAEKANCRRRRETIRIKPRDSRRLRFRYIYSGIHREPRRDLQLALKTHGDDGKPKIIPARPSRAGALIPREKTERSEICLFMKV